MTAIFEKIAFYWTYPFVRYALIVGVLIALCSSLLGVTLVLKRFSFIGDGLSHVAFGAMAIAAVLGLTDDMPPDAGRHGGLCRPAARTGQNTKIKGRCRRRHDLSGSAGHRVSADEPLLHLVQPLRRCVQHAVRLHLHPDAVKKRGLAVCGLSVVVVAVFLLYYNKIFAVTFDEDFCQGLVGTKADLYNLLLRRHRCCGHRAGDESDRNSLLISALVIFRRFVRHAPFPGISGL